MQNVKYKHPMSYMNQSRQWRLGSVTVRTLDVRPGGRWFDSRSGRYQVVSTWMGDCLRTEPFRYIANTKVNSAFHPFGVGKLSSAWLGLRRGTFTCVGWQVTLCGPICLVTLRSSEMGFPQKSIPFNYFLAHG